MYRRGLLARTVATVTGATGLAGCARVRERVGSASTDDRPADGFRTRSLRRWFDTPWSHSGGPFLVRGASISGLRAETDGLPEAILEGFDRTFGSPLYPEPDRREIDDFLWIESGRMKARIFVGGVETTAIVAAIEERTPGPATSIGNVDVYHVRGGQAIGIGPDLLIDTLHTTAPVKATRSLLDVKGWRPVLQGSGQPRRPNPDSSREERARPIVDRVITVVPDGHVVYVQPPGFGRFSVSDRDGYGFRPATGVSYVVDGAVTTTTITTVFSGVLEADEARFRSMIRSNSTVPLPEALAVTVDGAVGHAQGTVPTSELRS